MRPLNQSVRVLLFGLLSLALPFWGVGPAAAKRPAHPQQNQHWKQQIEGLEQQWRTAILTNDIPLMDKLLSDDYVGISMTGEVSTKTMQLDRLRTSKLTLSKLDLSDVKVKLVGRVAIVTSLADVAGTNDGVPIAGRFRYTRVYQKLASGAWKITNFEVTRLSDHHGRRHHEEHEATVDGNSSN